MTGGRRHDEDAPTAGPVARLRDRLAHAPGAAGAPPRFDPVDAPDGPAPLFASWLLRALDEGVAEPHVMTLSTVGEDGGPDARVLLLRGLDDDGGGCGFRFATDAGSPKGRQLAAVPRAALTWYWPAQGRQVRADGEVVALGAGAAREDFAHRSPASRAAAFTGRMSAPLDGPREYARERAAAERLIAGDPDAVPRGHTVHLLWARRVEFFQLAPDRFHQRLRYERADAGGGRWRRERLWP